jgi:Bacteriophage HK97-gp10, putative tail-component
MANGITITGFTEFQNKLNKLPGELLDDFDEAAEFAAMQWEAGAKRSAPIDQGFLRAGISHSKLKSGEWEVVSSKDYSAYMEWGTRSKVRVPAELASYAATFKGAGGQGDVKKAIYEWCKRVGIPEKAWWIVFITIMRVGVTPQPFFFIQRPIVEAQFIKNLQQIINTPR